MHPGGKIDKRKVVKFQLVDRSIEDPLSNDPNAAQKVLVPIYIGSDVKKEMVEKLTREMQQEDPSSEKKEASNLSTANMPKSTKQGIGAQYNKYFGVDIDDGEDYTKYFKAIDEGADDGVFIAPDGSVHDLKKREITDVDMLVDKFGIDRDVFGTEVDPTLPKLVEDTEYMLANDIDPEIFTAMDDDDAEPLDDDFFAKALALEDEDYNQAVESQPGVKKSAAKSYVSAAPSHLSHISHRSEAMDFVEEKVEHLLNTFYNNEEEELEEDEEEDGEGVDWDSVIDDFNKLNDPLRFMDNKTYHGNKPNPNLVLTENENENAINEEEEKKEPKEKWDCESILETYSTTDNLPCRIKEDNIPKKKKKQPKNDVEDEDQIIVPPDMMPKEGETKEEAKARKKAIKEYNRQRRQAKKEIKQKFQKATKKVKKSIAASGGSRGHSIIPLD